MENFPFLICRFSFFIEDNLTTARAAARFLYPYPFPFSPFLDSVEAQPKLVVNRVQFRAAV